jgi:putative transposase
MRSSTIPLEAKAGFALPGRPERSQHLEGAEADMSACATDQAAIEPESGPTRIDAVLASVAGRLGLLRCSGERDDFAAWRSLLRANTTAFGRETRRASSDPACNRWGKASALPSGKAPWGRKEEPLHEWQRLSPGRWDCKDPIVIIPKDRRKVFCGRLRRPIGTILRDLGRHRGVAMVEGPARPDHIHRCLSIPPKDSVAFVLGFLKGTSAVRIHREWLHERRISGLSFWAPGYGVSTVGWDQARVRP